jgi:L-seryl-tRNA(Ser) seleniumtransferase
MDTGRLLKRIPKVDDILAHPSIRALMETTPRALLLESTRAVLDEIRVGLRREQPEPEAPPSLESIVERVGARVTRETAWGLRRVVNATGVVIHTNLGRAPLAPEAVARMVEVSRGYSTLEYDLESGGRGSRHQHLSPLLCRLTGAESALVVNNNAAAVLLALNTLAMGREVIVSRGELVEIGGSFRIPDVMTRSGAILREVGTTNRTHPKDYLEAVGPATSLLLKVHTSNYRVVGFTSDVPLAALVGLGAQCRIPVMEDLGSGCLLDLSASGLPLDPPVRASIEAGADLVTFSGDKLLGGPQAGIIVGRRDLVSAIAANPLHRAVRIDKFTAAALEATLRLYLDEYHALRHVPVLAMIALDPETLRRRGRAFLRRVRPRLPEHLSARLVDSVSRAGGGSLPLQDLPSVAIAVASTLLGANDIEKRLRSAAVPVVGRIENDLFLLDLRTIATDELPLIADALAGLSG